MDAPKLKAKCCQPDYELFGKDSIFDTFEDWTKLKIIGNTFQNYY